MRERRRILWIGSSALVSWFLAAFTLSWVGFYQGAPLRAPTIQYGLLVPIIVGIVLFWRSPAFRRVIEMLPQQTLAGLQVFRVEGLIFLILYAQGRLPGAFALPAGMGDVLVGLLAPFVAARYARGSSGSRSLLVAWNLLGVGDLVVALTTGFLSSPSPLQMLAFDRPNELIGAFPLALIPVFLVPLAVLLHLASLYKLRQARIGSSVRISDPRIYLSGAQ